MTIRSIFCVLLALPAISLSCGAAAGSEIAPQPAVATGTDDRGEAQTPAAETGASAAPVQEASPSPGHNDDPWQKLNRPLYAIHDGIDGAVLRPLALGYVKVTPRFFRSGLHNALSNLHEPVVLANDALQLHPKEAGKSLFRIVTNTTLGVAGLFDVAKHFGVAHHDNDFGLTLGRMHIGAGPYVFVPLLGPTTVRDLIGDGVDRLADPLLWYHPDGTAAVEFGGTLLDGLNTRANVDGDLETMKATSLDPYTAIKSGYLQTRESAIRGDVVQLDELPGFDETPDQQTAKPSAPN